MLNRNKKEGHALIFYFPNTDAMLKSKKILSLLQSDVVSGGINMDFLTAFDTCAPFMRVERQTTNFFVYYTENIAPLVKEKLLALALLHLTCF